MPKTPKSRPDEDEQESRRFIEAAEKLVAAGELDLTDADAEVEKLLRQSSKRPKPPQP